MRVAVLSSWLRFRRRVGGGRHWGCSRSDWRSRGRLRISGLWLLRGRRRWGYTIYISLVCNKKRDHTRLPLNSTQTAFFLLSVQSCPATVGVIVFGGICRKPGPSLRGNFGCEGRHAGSRVSPGSTNVSVAIALSRK